MLDDGSAQPPLDPAVMAYLQGAPQQIPASVPVQVSPAVAPPPPQQIGQGQGTGVNGDEIASPDQDPVPSVTGGGGLHPDVANAIANGFQPPPQQPAPGPPVQSSPDYQLSPQQLKPIQAADAAANAAYTKAQALVAKQQAKQAAYAATPEGMQDAAYQQQQAANQKEQDLTKQQGDLDAKQAADEAVYKQQAAIDLQAQAVEQERKRQAALVEQQRLHADMMKAVDVAAKKVIDPNRYYNNMSTGGKIATKMGIILAGLGNGMSGNGAATNQAAQMFEEDIKNDIEAQKADMQQANDVVAMKRNGLDDYLKIAGNIDAAGTMKAAEMRNVLASQLEAVAAKYKNPNIQLGAQQIVAKLQEKSAGDLMDLAGKRVAEQQKAAELANQKRATDIAGGHLALAGKQFAYEQKKDERDFAEKQREHDDQIAERLLLAKNAGKDATVKQLEGIRKYGLRDPSSGDILLTPKGEKMKAQADQMEVQARGLPQAQADAVRTQAQALREQAENTEHLEHEKAPEVQDSLNSAQNVVDTVADIKAQLEKDPGMTDRATWATLSERYANAKANAIGFFKAKPSSKEMAAFEEFMGPDGSKLFDRSFSKEKMEAQADALSKSISADADTTLRGAGYKGGFRIEAHNGESLAPIAQQKTAVEQGESAERGTLGAQLPDADLKFRTNESRQLSAENAADTGPTGLSKQDTVNVSHLVTSYDKATDAERAKILTQLTAYANSPRDAVFNSVVPLIRDNPEVFAKIVSTLPQERQDQIKQNSSGIPAVRALPSGKKFVTPPFGGSRTD